MVTDVKSVIEDSCIKNFKFKIIKIRADCQYVRYFCYSENLTWAAQNLRLGRMRPEGRGLDIAGLNESRDEEVFSRNG